MEIVGIGTDIIECVRIGRMIEEHGKVFLERVYTPREIRYCQDRKHANEHFAGRWAAKEAILKCLGTGWRKGMCWTDLEVRNDPDGAPKVHVCGAAKERADSPEGGQYPPDHLPLPGLRHGHGHRRLVNRGACQSPSASEPSAAKTSLALGL